jgi:hypothetical protein
MKQHAAIVLGALAVLAAPGPAEAIPAFARRYKVECHFCHEGFPKLNTIGQRFRERGLRMEREDDFDAGGWIRSIPVTLRGWATHSFREAADDSDYALLKGVTAGNLGTRFSYWLDDSVFFDLTGDSDDSVTHLEPDNAWLRFDVLKGNKLYARAGRLELDLPFTQARTSHLFSYEIYFANTGYESDAIGLYQEGFELGGDFNRDTRWSAAVVKGRNDDTAEQASEDAGKFDANVFLRIARRAERNRFGAFAYIGRNTLYNPAGRLEWKDNILRLGADVDVWLQKLNLYGVLLYGRNDNAIATPAEPTGTGEATSFTGGFAQADFHVADPVVLTLRFNAASQPPDALSTTNETFTGLFPGIQLFFFQRAKLSFEYGFLNKGRDGFGAIQLEAAF